MAIETFNRFEHKYLVPDDVMEKMLAVMDEHMVMDKYCVNHSTYTIANLYYDTEDDILIRRSLEKPVYKEKLRMRAYGVPKKSDIVFLEIKKKFAHSVNKRRTKIGLEEAYRFCESGEQPPPHDYMNHQVCNELEYFINRYGVKPKVYIAYDRLAYFEENNHDLRISFDKNIRTRRTDLRLELGDYGTNILPDGVWLMEIKTTQAKPLWLCRIISSLSLKRISFSKYGTEFKHRTACRDTVLSYT